MRIEYWKPIPGYEGLYEVSSFGRVRSLDRWVKYSNGKLRLHKGKILILNKTKCGYYIIGLCIKQSKKYYLVHRLVYEAFNGKIPEGYEVNHINEDKTDNRLENLNLMTRKENVNWGTGHQRSAAKQRNHPNESKNIYQYTLDGVLVHVWPSMAEAARNGFDISAVYRCCMGKKPQYKGFLWSYTPLNLFDKV